MGLDHDGRIVSLVIGHSSPLPFRFRFFKWYCFDIVLQCSKTSLGRRVREGIRELIAWPSKSKVKIVLMIIENLVVKVRLMNWSPEMAAQSHHDFTTTTTIMPKSGFSLNPTLHWSLLFKKSTTTQSCRPPALENSSYHSHIQKQNRTTKILPLKSLHLP